MAKYLCKLFTAMAAVTLMLGFAMPSEAAFEKYLMQNGSSSDVYYKYDFNGLLASYNGSTDQQKALWNNFAQRLDNSGVPFAIYDTVSKKYINFDSILNAYNNNKNVVAYTEGRTNLRLVIADRTVIKQLNKVVYNQSTDLEEIPDVSFRDAYIKVGNNVIPAVLSGDGLTGTIDLSSLGVEDKITDGRVVSFTDASLQLTSIDGLDISILPYSQDTLPAVQEKTLSLISFLGNLDSGQDGVAIGTLILEFGKTVQLSGKLTHGAYESDVTLNLIFAN